MREHNYNTGASPGFGRGAKKYFFQIWKFACRETLLGGVRGHAPPAPPPPEKFFLNGAICCVLVYI